jgi:LPXTG-site transpeptidase (sortase) family protein
MTKQTRSIVAFLCAAASSTLSTGLILHAAFQNLDASILPQEELIWSGAMKDDADVVVYPVLHEAASIEAADTGDSGGDGGQITDERRQWELRRAYAIAIPDLSIRAPVFLPSRRYWDNHEWGLLEDQMQAGLLYGTVAYPHSSRPGVGPLVIAGHSSPPSDRASESPYGHVFARLPDIAISQHIVITDGEEQFRYAVTEMFIVPSSDTSILDLTSAGADSLTIITCYPVGTTRERYVVKATLVQ